MFDLAVIGSGPAGYTSAVGAALRGARVALIERGLPGGTCLNQGCVPSHALLHLAALIDDVRLLQGRGLAGDVRGDFAAALAHKDAVVRTIREGVGGAMKRLGVTVVRGAARFAGPGKISVTPHGGAEAECIEYRRAVVATGSLPRALAECPVDGRVVMDSRAFMFSLDRLPREVLCVGGGAIGVELGFVLAQFGSRVRIVERRSRLLDTPRVPEDASDLLERRLAQLEIDVRLGAVVAEYTRDGMGARVTLSDGHDARYDLVLVAVGRVPNLAGLELESIGATTTPEGFLAVNEYLETSVPGVYAVGDVRSGPMTANAALHDAKMAVGNAFGGERQRANYFRVPFVVRSAVEIACVGYTEAQAEAAGFTPRVVRSSLGASCKGRARNDYEGYVEVVHDAETGQLLGGCIVGPEAGEQIHVLAAACQSPRGLWLLKDLSYCHPSWCEELERAVDASAARFVRSARDPFRPGIFAQEFAERVPT